MRVRLWQKLFFVFVVIAVSVLVITAGLMRWSFNQGFLDYLNDMERSNLTRVAERLVGVYDPETGWSTLIDDPQLWFRFVAPERRPPPPPQLKRDLLSSTIEGLPPEPPPPPLPDGGSLPPPDALRIGSRMGLFDTERRFVAGNPRADVKLDQAEPVSYAGVTVGYIAIVPMKEVTDRVDLRFMERQKRTLVFIVIIVLFWALFAALIFARSRTLVFRKIAENARQLAEGNYATRIQIVTNDELGDLAADINALAEALSKNREARQRWFADISHELRTPLTILRGELQAIEDGVRPFDESARFSLACEVQRMGKLVEDLYQLALSDQGALSYRKEAVYLVELVIDVADSFLVRLSECKLTLEMLLPTDEAITVLADEDRLTQLLVNLLENSIRYTDSGGLIQICVECENNEVLVIVQDSAPGVPSAALPKLFDRLYRVEASRSRASGGSGLGLAICKNISEAHGGGITATASPLGGLRVELRLPRLC